MPLLLLSMSMRLQRSLGLSKNAEANRQKLLNSLKSCTSWYVKYLVIYRILYILSVVGISSINSMTIWRKVWVNFEIRPWSWEVMMVYIPGTPNCRFFFKTHRCLVIPTISPDLESSSNWRHQPFISMVGHQLPGVFVDVTSNISWLSKVTGWGVSLIRGRKMGFRESAWLQKDPSSWNIVCSLRHRKVTVDGSEIRNNHRKGCIKPCNGRTVYQPKLVQDFSYQQYHTCIQRYNV